MSAALVSELCFGTAADVHALKSALSAAKVELGDYDHNKYVLAPNGQLISLSGTPNELISTGERTAELAARNKNCGWVVHRVVRARKAAQTAKEICCTAPHYAGAGEGIPQRGGKIWNRDDWLKMKDETWAKYGHRLVWEVSGGGCRPGEGWRCVCAACINGTGHRRCRNVSCWGRGPAAAGEQHGHRFGDAPPPLCRATPSLTPGC